MDRDRVGEVAFRRYDPEMVRLLTIVSAVLAMTLVVCSPANSNASPAESPGQCSFVLEKPTVVQISGVNQVMARTYPGPCTLEATPNYSTVCLSIVGDDSPGQCASINGPRPAVLYYTYRPGATYVVKGKGCANTYTPPYTLCQDIPESRATL